MKLKAVAMNFLNPAYGSVMVYKLKLRLLNRAVDKKAAALSLSWCQQVRS